MNNYAYLMLVDSDENHNKFYEITENDDFSLTVNYGRVGGHITTKRYSSWEKDFYSLLSSKTRKGYKDVSHYRTVEEESTYLGIENKSINDFVEKMLRRQEKMLKSFASIENVTPDMIAKARDMLSRLKQKVDEIYPNIPLSSINYSLAEYFEVLPRTMRNVADFAFQSTDRKSLDDVFQREEALLDAIEGKLAQTKNKAVAKGEKDILTANGISLEEITYKEEDMIFDKLQGNVSKYMSAFKVVNEETEKAFKDNLKNKPMKTHLLWHGSPNKNWWSIATNGLDIKKANNGMFGRGIYFAPKSTKSMGYMSTGSYWRGGNDDSGYLALFEVATGRTYTPSSTLYGSPSDMNKMLSSNGCDSVWAKTNSRGFTLRNEEVIIYNNNQATIRYIVEVSADDWHIPHDITPFKGKDAKHFVQAFEDKTIDDNGFSLKVNIALADSEVKSELSKVTEGRYMELVYDKEAKFYAKDDKDNYIDLQEGDERYLFRELKKAFFESEAEFVKYDSIEKNFTEEKESEEEMTL